MSPRIFIVLLLMCIHMEFVLSADEDDSDDELFPLKIIRSNSESSDENEANNLSSGKNDPQSMLSESKIEEASDSLDGNYENDESEENTAVFLNIQADTLPIDDKYEEQHLYQNMLLKNNIEKTKNEDVKAEETIESKHTIEEEESKVKLEINQNVDKSKNAEQLVTKIKSKVTEKEKNQQQRENDIKSYPQDKNDVEHDSQDQDDIKVYLNPTSKSQQNKEKRAKKKYVQVKTEVVKSKDDENKVEATKYSFPINQKTINDYLNYSETTNLRSSKQDKKDATFVQKEKEANDVSHDQSNKCKRKLNHLNYVDDYDDVKKYISDHFDKLKSLDNQKERIIMIKKLFTTLKFDTIASILKEFEEMYSVEKILSEWYVNDQKDNVLHQYLIKWKGYEDPSWEPVGKFMNNIIARRYQKRKTSATMLKVIRVEAIYKDNKSIPLFTIKWKDSHGEEFKTLEICHESNHGLTREQKKLLKTLEGKYALSKMGFKTRKI